MSFAQSFENALKAEVAKPEVREAIEGLEAKFVNAGLSAFESVLPGPIKMMVGALLDAVAAKGLAAVESWTDKELQAFAGTVVLDGPDGKMTLHYTPNT